MKWAGDILREPPEREGLVDADRTPSFLRVPYRAVIDHARGDRQSIDVWMVVAYVDSHLSIHERRSYPCTEWIRQGLGWSWYRASRALKAAVARGLLRSWQAPVEFVYTDEFGTSKSAVMATRYTIVQGAISEARKESGWLPLRRQDASRSRLYVAALLASGYEEWSAGVLETTTVELARALGCSDRHVRRLKALQRHHGMVELDEPRPGRRFALLNYPGWLGRETIELPYMGTTIAFATDARAKARWSKQLVSVRDRLNQHMDGARVVQGAVEQLREQLGQVPTARQVVRFITRSRGLRHLFQQGEHENHARTLLGHATFYRSAEAIDIRRRGLHYLRGCDHRRALAAAGAPPG